MRFCNQIKYFNHFYRARKREKISDIIFFFNLKEANKPRPGQFS